jgi:hypothetical protein
MAAGALPKHVADPVTPSDARGPESVIRARLQLAPPESNIRGQLRAHVERELEQRLLDLGACARPAYVVDCPEQILGDQVYRARMLGYRALDISLGSLSEIAIDGVLEPADGNTLEWWAAAVHKRQDMAFCLAQSDRTLLVYGPPVPLAQRFGHALLGDPIQAAPSLASQTQSSTPEQERPEPVLPSPVRARTLTAVPTPASQAPRANGNSLRGAMRHLLDDTSKEAPLVEGVSETSVYFTTQPSSEPEATEAERTADEGAPIEPAATADAVVAVESESALESGAVSGAPQDRFEDWLRGLESTSGNLSYADLERLFCQNYLPLRQAQLDGHASAAGARAVAQFSSNFAQSYARAFEALRSRGKRPNMVFDVPNLAFRLARQHAAPKHHMLLVDAMRFDIGARVEARLQLQLLGQASCIARGMLWAALPANSSAQLELLARGPEGLRQLSGSLDETQIMSKGADVRTLRPMRVGPHHLWKLDTVQHQVTHNDLPFTSTRLMQCSADVAVSVGRFIKDQPQGTLVFVFGDHGFNADGSAQPSPEQVLVPYQAWLVRSTPRKEGTPT